MNRRSFLGWGLSTPAAALLAQTGPAREEPVEAMMPEDSPAIALNHLGFLPGARKTVIFRYAGEDGPADFQIRDIGGGGGGGGQTPPLSRGRPDGIGWLGGGFWGMHRG